ncbi:predicted protein, partial [Nematostella vectensis]
MLTSLEIGLTVAFTCLVITDLVGNTLVIWVVVRYRMMRTPMNYLLVNLAIADMMFALFITPRFIFNHTFKHPQGTAGHYLCGNLTWTGGDASVFSLVAIATERYFAVVWPLNNERRITSRKLKCLVSGSWMFAVLMTFPLYTSVTYSETEHQCAEAWGHVSHAKAYSMCCFLFLGVIPLTIMAGLYSRITHELWFKGARVTSLTQRIVLSRRKRVTRMVIIVSSIYAATWMPNLTSYILNYYHPNFAYGDTFYLVSICLVSVNSTVNPFVYTLQSQRFRRCV